MRNCQAGLETYSDRRMAELMGVSRAHLWRTKLLAELPEDLFERLLTERRTAGRMPSLKGLANVALALRGNMKVEAEHCRHCGGLLRLRERASAKTSRVVVQWLEDTGQLLGHAHGGQ